MNKNHFRWVPPLTVVLAVAQVAVIMSSWLVAALWPQSGVRSLLSSEGIRWFFGQFTHNIACAPVVWLLLLSMGWGAMQRGGLWNCLRRLLCHAQGASLKANTRFALFVVTIEVLIVVAVMVLLTCLPHAVLLNVQGGLCSGAFPASIVPVAAFTMVFTGLTFGSLGGALPSLDDHLEALSHGIRQTASWWLPVILSVQLYYSLRFILITP